jgi:hypothetical protein
MLIYIEKTQVGCHSVGRSVHGDVYSSNCVMAKNTTPKQNALRVCTTNFMELSASCEAANCVATEEFPSILWNPKVHHRVHKTRPLVPILRQIDPVHTVPLYLSKIRFNIVHPPTCNDLIGNPTRDLPACSIVPQPTTLQRAF